MSSENVDFYKIYVFDVILPFWEIRWPSADHLIWTWRWRHQMETFSVLLAICAGNSLVTGEFLVQSQWRGALMFSLVSAWTNDGVNTREAGDFRCHHAHFYVTVMFTGKTMSLYWTRPRCWPTLKNINGLMSYQESVGVSSHDHSIQLVYHMYCKTSSIGRTLVSNIFVDHSDVVGASPVGAAPTTSSFST